MKTKRASEKKSPRVTRGGGNVFADVGFDSKQAAELQVKAELARQIYYRIKAIGLTQTEAPVRLGLTHRHLSKLINAW